MKELLITFIAIPILLFGLSFIGNAVGLFNLEFWGTKVENAHRNIFEESKSHVHGTIQNISRLRMEYKTTPNEGHRAALREMILTEVAPFDKTKLPDDLYRFVQELERM